MHYQYHHDCASTFAKSAPGNPGGPGGRWEIQFSQLSPSPNGASTIWGTAVKVGAVTLENWGSPYATPTNGHKLYYVNGEYKELQLETNRRPISLPNGLHFWNDGNTLCVLQEGQFLFRQTKDVVALLVPKKVKTQGRGTVCHDKSNKDGPYWRTGHDKEQSGKVIKNAQVEQQPGLMTHVVDIYRRSVLSGQPSASMFRSFKPAALKCLEMKEPDVNDSPPPDPESACEEHDFPITKAEESCGPLKEEHPGFYEDCLIDECMNGEAAEDEVEMIQDVIEGDEAVDAAVLSEEEACEALPTFTIKDPTYSNLAGQGPDSDDKGILYPDAAVVDGELVDVLVTSKKFKSSNPTKNGASGGLLVLNMKCGKSATVTITIVDKDKVPVVVPSAVVSVLDIDEGKNGKARTTVSSCGALSATAGPELTSADVAGEAGCKAYSSSKHGGAANNPLSLNDITEDHKKRVVTFLYGQGSSFEFDVAIAKASKGRNLAFSLSPVLACKSD